MSEAPTPFRDEATANASQNLPAARDPFRAPTVSSTATEPVAVDDGSPPPRISPMWAILLGSLIPYHAAFWTAFILVEYVQSDWLGKAVGFLAHFVLMTSFEAVAFQARSLWLGPGRAILRVPTALLAIASVALLPGWLGMLTPFEGIEGEGSLEFAVLRLLGAGSALIAGGVVFAIGSRDVARSGNRLAVSGVDLAAVICVGVLFLLTVLPFVVGAVDISETRRTLVYYDVRKDLARPLVATAALLLMSTTWRFGIRGIERFFSWKTLLFFLASVPWLLLLVGIVADIYAGRVPGLNQPLAAIAAFYLVPPAREFFLRFAGYRAINVYAERRR